MPRRRNPDVHVLPDPKARPGRRTWYLLARGVPTQRLAQAAGRAAAKVLRSELTTHGAGGRIRAKDSFGRDPRRSKG